MEERDERRYEKRKMIKKRKKGPKQGLFFTEVQTAAPVSPCYQGGVGSW
jgi:hypothetical protein